jgi:hypothetical protein
VSAVVFLALTFSFKYEKENGEYIHEDGQKVTVSTNSFVWWLAMPEAHLIQLRLSLNGRYAVVIVEAIAVVSISSLWRVVSFKHTHLVERVGILTLIVMGEGIIGMTKSVTYIARYSAYTTSAIIGVVVAAVSLIVCSTPGTLHLFPSLRVFVQYLLWVLYFYHIEHD